MAALSARRMQLVRVAKLEDPLLQAGAGEDYKRSRGSSSPGGSTTTGSC